LVALTEFGLDEKYGDNKDLEKQLKKERDKERPSSSAFVSSQFLFKVEVKVDIKPYQEEINVVEFNQWLQQLEVYFSFHNIGEEKKTSFV